MTLRTFLYAVDALMQEEGVSFRVETNAEPQFVPEPADVRAQNQQSMAMFQGLMKGVQGAPGVKR